MSEELPQGWRATKLGNVSERITKGATPTSYGFEYLSKGIAFVKVENLRDGFIDRKSIHHFISEEAHDNQKRSKLQEGDILFSIAGTIGATCIVRGQDLPANTNQALAIIRGTSPIFLSGFLQRQLESEVALSQARAKERGGGMHNISLEDVREMEVVVAPFNEQRRIVAKLEKLLAQVDACHERLTKISSLLRRFRQSVLAAACSGRLTVDWREENLAKATETTENVPDGWSPSSVGDVLESLKYGTAMKCGYEQRGVPVLRIPNVVSGQIDPADLKFAELPTQELSQLRLRPGDILLIRSNGSVSLVGRSAIVSEEQTGFAYAGYLIRLRPNRAKIEPEFLNLVLASYDVRLQIELQARSTSGVNNINSEEVQALRLLLPPPPEQKEIVRRVENLFALADRLEAHFTEGQERVNSITQAVLVKAFRGELVPTEFELAKAEGRSFESAEELLERTKGNGNIKQTEAKRPSKSR